MNFINLKNACAVEPLSKDLMPPRKNAAKTRGRPFPRGNPGKPTGARHKITLAVESLLDGEAERLTRKAIDLALAGDVTALRLCLDRIAPLRKGRPVSFALPDVRSPQGLTDALAAILEAMAAGELTTEEASAICAILDIQRRSLETVELESRLVAIEQQLRSSDAQGN
jgi:hypothetical protein